MNEKKNLNPIKLLIGVFLSLTLIISIIFIGVILMPVEHLYVAAKDLTAEVTESDRPTNFAPCEMHDSATGAICDEQALVVSSERELAYVFKHGVEIAGGGKFYLPQNRYRTSPLWICKYELLEWGFFCRNK